MSTPRSDSLAGIREQAPLEMNAQLSQSLWILWLQSQLPFFGRILPLFLRPVIPLGHSLEPQEFVLNRICFPIHYSLPFLPPVGFALLERSFLVRTILHLNLVLAT